MLQIDSTLKLVMCYLDVPVAMVTVFKDSSVIVRESEGETPAPTSEQSRHRQLTMRAPCFFHEPTGSRRHALPRAPDEDPLS